MEILIQATQKMITSHPLLFRLTNVTLTTVIITTLPFYLPDPVPIHTNQHINHHRMTAGFSLALMNQSNQIQMKELAD